MANGLLTGAYRKGAGLTQAGLPQRHAAVYPGGPRRKPGAAPGPARFGGKQPRHACPALSGLDAEQKPYIVPIPGSRKIERMRENAGAADVNLSAAEVAQLDHILETISMSAVFGGTEVVRRKRIEKGRIPMKHNHKWLTLALSGVLTLSLLAGCAGTQ